MTEIECRDEEDGRVSLRGRLLWRISGTATDNLGGRYNFSYQLRFTKPAQIPGQGVVVDTFTLTGTGVANGFSTLLRAKVTFDSGFNPVGFEFDTLHSLHHDNTCGGCHSPTNGFGDSQGMAIGVQNNGFVGPNRAGPRNQRRSPLVINTAFLSALMWNGRFSAPSGDPFDNSLGFHFPPPEDDARFPPGSPVFRHLLQAQAHIPPTEMVEVAGFTGVCRSNDLGRKSLFCQFDDGLGEIVPSPDATGFRNKPIRRKGLELLNHEPEYRRLFGELFPEVAGGKPIDFRCSDLRSLSSSSR